MTVIKKLELIHFGKFKDTVIDLKDGENRFDEANEWGKSTITDFIIYMLYGFKKTAKKSITLEENFLKKYLPWDDDSHIFGAMEIEKDGKLIRIERKTLASGRMNLTVCDSGGNALDIAEPGAELFGIDAGTFMRTFLVRQTDMVFEGTDGIETALKNLVTTGDEQTSFDAALKIIVDKKNKFQHGERRFGRIFDLPKLITDKKLERSSLLSKKASLEDALSQYADLQQKLSGLEKTEKEIEAKRDVCIGNDAKKLVLRAEQLISERDSYAKKLTDGEKSVTENDIRTATEVFNKRELAQTYLNNAQAQLDGANAELDKSKGQLAGVEYIAENKTAIVSHLAKKPKVNIPLVVVGAVITLICAVLSVLITPFFAIGVMVGIMLVAMPFVTAKAKLLFDKTNDELSADLERYNTAVADIEAKQKAADTAKAEYDKQTVAFASAEGEVIELKEKYGITELSELSTRLAESRQADMVRSHIERLDRELASLLGEKPLDSFKELAKNSDGSDLGVYDLDRMSREIAQQKSTLAMSLSQLEKSRIECDTILERINDLAVEIKALETELSEAEYQNSVLGVARDVLTEAYEKINNDYSPILSQKISPYLFALTGGKYSDAVLDRQFNIRVKYKGEYKELGFFSRGTADCVYLAVRLAMAEILEGESALPLILDDPFWSFDSKRLDYANNLTHELSQKRQILVFCAK